MLSSLKSLFGRKPSAPAVPAPVGETVMFNVYSTRIEIEQPTFPHTLHGRRDLSDPDLLEHLNGFCGFIFERGDAEMTQDKYHVILHIQRVQHHLKISVGVNDTASLFAWAAAANAILFTHDDHVIDPQGRILVNGIDGKADPEARLPYLAQALARKAATEALLAARGIEVPTTLPPLICEDELSLRERDEVVDRARALLLVALRAESVASGQPMPVETLLSKMPLGEDGLSPQERAFLDQDAPSQHDCAQFVWRYESLHLFEWALGLVDELDFPAASADSAAIVATMIAMRGPALRDAGAILDALDLHYRVHWVVRQARLKKQGEVVGIDADVVMERHRALNWLVRFQHAGWDSVDTPT